MNTQANKTNKTWLEKALALLNISEQDKTLLWDRHEQSVNGKCKQSTINRLGIMVK